jgi:hypothetical protein
VAPICEVAERVRLADGDRCRSVDSGGREGRTQKIYNWCHARHSRRIYAGERRLRPLEALGTCEEGQRRHAARKRRRGRGKTPVVDMIAREPFPREVSGNRDPAAARFARRHAQPTCAAAPPE